MKKNRMMRLASILLVCVLLSTSVISGTFAKYVTQSGSQDTARVAKWGFTDTATISLDNLFDDVYDGENGIQGVTIDGTDNIIAPGTTNEVSFQFIFDGEGGDDIAPEVDYTFVVSTAGSTIDTHIENNPNIEWGLDGQYFENKDGKSWTKLLAAIDALDGNVTDNKYEAGDLPDAFYGAAGKENGAATHTISWRWLIDDGSANKDAEDNTQNKYDTAMGNNSDLEKVTLIVSITATQVD